MLKKIFYLNWEKTTKVSSNNSKDSKNDPNENENDKKILKFFGLWLIISCGVLWLFQKLFPVSSKGFQEISWNEFYYEMLSKGEVEKIIINLDRYSVKIVLYDDAVIHGKTSSFKVYFMKIANVPNFEAKIREAEKRLGIKPDQCVEIIYERPLMKFVLISVILQCIIMALFVRKIPLSMSNLFVIITK